MKNLFEDWPSDDVEVGFTLGILQVHPSQDDVKDEVLKQHKVLMTHCTEMDATKLADGLGVGVNNLRNGQTINDLRDQDFRGAGGGLPGGRQMSHCESSEYDAAVVRILTT